MTIASTMLLRIMSTNDLLQPGRDQRARPGVRMTPHSLVLEHAVVDVGGAVQVAGAERHVLHRSRRAATMPGILGDVDVLDRLAEDTSACLRVVLGLQRLDVERSVLLLAVVLRHVTNLRLSLRSFVVTRFDSHSRCAPKRKSHRGPLRCDRHCEAYTLRAAITRHCGPGWL